MPIQSLSIAPASDDSGRIVSNPEATGNLKDRHADYTASRTSSILNGRANQFGWFRPLQPINLFLQLLPRTPQPSELTIFEFERW